MKKVYIYNWSNFVYFHDYYDKKYNDNPTIANLKVSIVESIANGADVGSWLCYSVSSKNENKCYHFVVAEISDKHISVQFLGMMKG